MASAAISAQGSRIYISNGEGSAKTITAVTKAAEAVVTTSAPHGLALGDTVTFAAVTGMPELNGKVAKIVALPSATSFTINVDSTLFAAAGTAGTATPKSYVSSCEITQYSGLDGESADLETTTICSDGKEFITGLADAGNFTLNFNVVLKDIGQIELRKAQEDRQQRQFKLVLPTGEVIAFAGSVKSYTIDGGTDAVLTGSSSIKISGKPEFILLP